MFFQLKMLLCSCESPVDVREITANVSYTLKHMTASESLKIHLHIKSCDAIIDFNCTIHSYSLHKIRSRMCNSLIIQCMFFFRVKEDD